jgi:hypothetical protein
MAGRSREVQIMAARKQRKENQKGLEQGIFKGLSPVTYFL